MLKLNGVLMALVALLSLRRGMHSSLTVQVSTATLFQATLSACNFIAFAHGEPAEKSTTEYLDDAKRFVAAGQLGQAVEAYDAAVAKDPQNYMTRFRRAALLLKQGRNNAALDDFDHILKVKPDFDQVISAWKTHDPSSVLWTLTAHSFPPPVLVKLGFAPARKDLRQRRQL
jgi:tetratricopeptide (TPR) repeat protein